MGSFRLAAGNRHLHRYYNFAGCVVETAVSYTHLDVYKRHIKKSEKQGLFNALDLGAVWLERALKKQ